ncbi:MAG TPA: DUF4390 domain-containing protein [Gammaproteobacteria bacterium]|nr:DUF4390 domain-containing protein [Gammaproteobacteria bacterium]
MDGKSYPVRITLMVFIMRAFLKKINWRVLTGMGLLCLSQVIYAEFSIHYAKTRLIDDVYVLDAQISYDLTEVTRDALQNGISLTLVLTMVIERDRWYLWNEEMATLKQRYQVKYYTLSDQYVVEYLNTGIEETFGSLNAALTRLGQLESFPLLDQHLTKPDKRYWVYLQTHLDIESLPVPLRPIAYLSSQWRLSSNWYLCPLEP